MDAKPESYENKGSLLLRILSNPIIGFGVGVLGIILSVFFYFQSLRNREVVYSVSPVKTIVVKSGQASNLKVYFAGEELKGDVSAVQIALWNRGKDSTRSENVLEPIILRTDPTVRILEVTIRKQSRNVVRLSLDEGQMSKGEVGLRWNILEKGDGAVLQVVYAGTTESRISIAGTIEGQGGIKDVGNQYLGNQPESTQGRAKASGFGYWVVLSLLVFMVSFSIFVLILLRIPAWQARLKYRPEDIRQLSKGAWMLSGMGLGLLALFLFSYYHQASQVPPFGF